MFSECDVTSNPTLCDNIATKEKAGHNALLLSIANKVISQHQPGIAEQNAPPQKAVHYNSFEYFS